MTFGPSHWRKPRQTIATRFKNDDLSYATHGAILAMECVRRLGIGPGEAAKMRLLDYGCGTGRVARVLTGYFGHVTAYDPVPECIAEGRRECRGINFHNLTYTDALPKGPFDVVISVNVIEHLTPADQRTMLANLKAVSKKGTICLLWYAIQANRAALLETFGHGFGHRSWADEDEDFLVKNPKSLINTRVFLFH